MSTLPRSRGILMPPSVSRFVGPLPMVNDRPAPSRSIR